MSLFEEMSEIFKPETLTVKASIVVMSHLSDAQELNYMNQIAESNMHINFAKFIVIYCNGNLSMEINVDALWSKFIEKSIERERNIIA